MGHTIEIGQDGAYWVQQGYLDFIAPMVYIEYMTPTTISSFRTHAQWCRNRYAPNHEIPMVFFIENSVGTPEYPNGIPIELFAQTYQVIQETGINADGFAVFRYAGPGWTDILDIRPHLDACTKTMNSTVPWLTALRKHAP